MVAETKPEFVSFELDVFWRYTAARTQLSCFRGTGTVSS